MTLLIGVAIMGLVVHLVQRQRACRLALEEALVDALARAEGLQAERDQALTNARVAVTEMRDQANRAVAHMQAQVAHALAPHRGRYSSVERHQILQSGMFGDRLVVNTDELVDLAELVDDTLDSLAGLPETEEPTR